MSRHARMNPEKYEAPDDWESREARALIAEGRGDELSIPMPPPRRLTDSRTNPYGQDWTIEDALALCCAHGNEVGNCADCALANWEDRIDMDAKAIGRGEVAPDQETR